MASVSSARVFCRSSHWASMSAQRFFTSPTNLRGTLVGASKGPAKWQEIQKLWLELLKIDKYLWKSSLSAYLDGEVCSCTMVLKRAIISCPPYLDAICRAKFQWPILSWCQRYPCALAHMLGHIDVLQARWTFSGPTKLFLLKQFCLWGQGVYHAAEAFALKTTLHCH